MRKKLWVTYAWADNEDKDIDYIASALNAAGIDVKLTDARLSLVRGFGIRSRETSQIRHWSTPSHLS